jgi:hypothetical protein
MWPMPIVAMQPVEQFGCPLVRVLIGAGVGPFAKCSLDEALSFSVGLRSVWPGEDLTKAEAFTGCMACTMKEAYQAVQRIRRAVQHAKREAQLDWAKKPP